MGVTERDEMRCGNRIVTSALSETYCMRIPGHEGKCSVCRDPGQGEVTDLMVIRGMRETWARKREGKDKGKGKDTYNGT
jgi:hypothetical protein